MRCPTPRCRSSRLVALNLGFTVAGSVQVETVFSWPGWDRRSTRRWCSATIRCCRAPSWLLAVSVVVANALADLGAPGPRPASSERRRDGRVGADFRPAPGWSRLGRRVCWALALGAIFAPWLRRRIRARTRAADGATCSRRPRRLTGSAPTTPGRRLRSPCSAPACRSSSASSPRRSRSESAGRSGWWPASSAARPTAG